MAEKMRATIFVEPGRIVLGEKPIPDVGPLDALIRVTTTTICGTDIHILKEEYPVASGLTVGHDHAIRTTLCPGGKERMRRLMAAISGGRVDTAALVTHHFSLDDIETAYALFGHQRDGVLKVAIRP